MQQHKTALRCENPTVHLTLKFKLPHNIHDLTGYQLPSQTLRLLRVALLAVVLSASCTSHLSITPSLWWVNARGTLLAGPFLLGTG